MALRYSLRLEEALRRPSMTGGVAWSAFWDMPRTPGGDGFALLPGSASGPQGPLQSHTPNLQASLELSDGPVEGEAGVAWGAGGSRIPARDVRSLRAIRWLLLMQDCLHTQVMPICPAIGPQAVGQMRTSGGVSSGLDAWSSPMVMIVQPWGVRKYHVSGGCLSSLDL